MRQQPKGSSRRDPGKSGLGIWPIELSRGLAKGFSQRKQRPISYCMSIPETVGSPDFA